MSRWETTRAAHLIIVYMAKLRNLQEHICSFDNLYKAYLSARKGKTNRTQVLSFEMNLAENLFKLRDELMNRTYKVGPYREFYVHYPKPRLVMAIGFRDRVVQWAIYRQVNPYADRRFIAQSYGCRTDKGTLRAATQLMNWLRIVNRKPDAKDYWIIKGDISKYFYRVDHEIVLDCYRQICDEDWFMWLMDVIVNNPDVPFGLPEGMSIDDCPRGERLYNVGQPIGNLTSQATANIYLNRFDQWCKHTLKLRYYERSMDDFQAIVKGRKNAETIARRMAAFLKDELHLNMSAKTRILRADKPVEFVGYIVSCHGLRLRKKTVYHIKRSCKKIAAKFADGRLSYDQAKERIICYLGMTKRVNAAYLRGWIGENVVLQRKEP